MTGKFSYYAVCEHPRCSWRSKPHPTAVKAQKEAKRHDDDGHKDFTGVPLWGAGPAHTP